MFPPPRPPDALDDPFGVPFGRPVNNENAAAIWRERQQRQRNLRFLMMFVMLLLLMEGEEQPGLNNDPHHMKKLQNSLKQQLLKTNFLPEKVYKDRKSLDRNISRTLKIHPRHMELTLLNHATDSGDQLKLQTSNGLDQTKSNKIEKKEKDSQDLSDMMIHHYPRNATGYYRGDWERQPYHRDDKHEISKKIEELIKSNATSKIESAMQMQSKLFQSRGERIGVYLFEDGIKDLFVQEVENDEMEDPVTDIEKAIMKHFNDVSKGDTGTTEINAQGGKAAFQLYSKPILGMNEISFVDGFIKLFDGAGFSSRDDILLRVRGIAVHSIGRLSLLANAAPNESGFYIQTDNDYNTETKIRLHELNSDQTVIQKSKKEMKENDILEKVIEDELQNRRRLTQTFEELNQLSSNSPQSYNYKAKQDNILQKLRNIAFEMQFLAEKKTPEFVRNGWTKLFESHDFASFEDNGMDFYEKDNVEFHRRLQSEDETDAEKDTTSIVTDPAVELRKELMKNLDIHPYPYVPEDEDFTERKSLGIRRNIPLREQAFEFITMACQFEVNLDTTSTQWEASELEKLLAYRKEKIKDAFNPQKKQKVMKLESAFENDTLLMDTLAPSLGKKDMTKPKEALMMELTGTIISPACEFAANVTVTALRIDWEETKGKAIKYSFYMMLTCLAQIVLLLRQLLHTQAQSIAVRVSLLCIGWQTLLDAILCIAHILLCVVMSPLLPAFSSVAFFKLLIFGVIEMKYMAIIMRARITNADPNSTTESIRRSVTFLQAKFYAALFLSSIIYWYIGRHYLTFYVLVLYSFWVPQIIQNIITEAKRPLHKHYIYGMSLTRLLAPVYIYAIPYNFWKTANPDFESNFILCEVVVLWVGIQTAILVAQSKFGARFMIPARFLPPKFDYGRPIPPALLATLENSTPVNEVEIGSGGGGSGVGARNRINGQSSRQRVSPTTLITEDSDNGAGTLDCVICYSPIDIHNSRRYMLAPCDHLFHRDCLEQWMDVKMECPICRTDLPSI